MPDAPATPLRALTRDVIASAPTRIDFGGGWTDVPPYPERDGGFVCNVTISLRARVHLGAADAPVDPLARAALRRAGVTGVATMDATFPVGAGLGGSSAAGVALQCALAAAASEAVSADELARRSRAVEVEELGIAGGWQDHYASAHGGALAIDLGATHRVDRIGLDGDMADALARRCVLVYTGETRISSANITAVLDRYAARDPAVVGALARMAALARQMAGALRAADIDALGALVGEHWIEQRSLHPAITTSRIDEIMRRAAGAGALGAKALGASGGGCVVIVTPDDPAPVAAAVSDLGTVLDYAVDARGAIVETP